ncbi:MAG: prepilin peptidase [Alphaproteobacteria bacterium]
MLLLALSVIFLLIMIWAMVSDLRTFEIPNWLPLTLVVTYPLAALSAGMSWQPIFAAFALGGLMLVAAVILFRLGLLGGGDGKLLAAAVLWTGSERVLEFLAVTALAGGVLALALLSYRKFPLAAVLSGFPTMRRLHAEKRDVPYAVAIGAAGLINYPHLPILNS